jgi:uncharacterized protein (TIGR03435 family)
MKITPARALLCLVLLCCGSAAGQPTKFEIADVTVSQFSWDYHKRTLGGSFLSDGLFELKRATMLDLIRIAWATDPSKVVGGPSWLDMDRFDVRAKTPEGTTQQTMRLMLRALLAERFELVTHNETRPVPAWTLTVGKNLQLKRADAATDPGCKSDSKTELRDNGSPSLPVIEFTCRNISMAEFASRLTEIPGGYMDGNTTVADRTQLTGPWNFTFKLTPRGGTTGAEHVVTLFDGIEQLGLKLEPAPVPTEVLVVDRANQKPTPNSPDVAKSFPALPKEFEVAVVKPSPQGDRTLPGYSAAGDTRIQYLPGGRVNAQGNLRGVIRWVWGVNDIMLEGLPSFADADSWDIAAKAGGDVGDFDTLTEMLKNLLVNRFKLTWHTEERPIMTYTLTATKPKLKKADPASRTGCKEGPAVPTKSDPRDSNPLLGRLLTCTNTSMSQLAFLLFRGMASGYVKSPVVDATGLQGGWDFTLSFSAPGQIPGGDTGGSGAGIRAAAASDPNGTVSLPDAMEKQIGIRMELQKHPVEVLVIDHLERKPTEN